MSGRIERLTAFVVVSLAIAVPASPASAVEVTQEGGGHCPPVVVVDHVPTGGCLLQGASETGSSIELGAPFGTMYLCDWTFQIRVDEDGEGFMLNQALYAPGTTNPCALQPQKELDECGDPRVTSWPFELTSQTTAEATFEVNGGGGFNLNAHLAGVVVSQSTHTGLDLRTPGSTHKSTESPLYSLGGHWVITAGSPGVEIS